MTIGVLAFAAMFCVLLGALVDTVKEIARELKRFNDREEKK